MQAGFFFKCIDDANSISVVSVKRLILIIVGAAAFILLLRFFVVDVVYVQSNSMQPLISKGDGLAINNLAFGFHAPWAKNRSDRQAVPERGELVVFQNPFDHNHLWLKRVIGLPGDTIHFRDHKLLLNGTVISGFDKNNHETIPTTGGALKKYRVWSSYLEEDWGPVTVPAGHLFVMGDHRGASIDSRVWGAIPQNSLRGTVLLRFWPYDALSLF